MPPSSVPSQVGMESQIEKESFLKFAGCFTDLLSCQLMCLLCFILGVAHQSCKLQQSNVTCPLYKYLTSISFHSIQHSLTSQHFTSSQIFDKSVWELHSNLMSGLSKQVNTNTQHEVRGQQKIKTFIAHYQNISLLTQARGKELVTELSF